MTKEQFDSITKTLQDHIDTQASRIHDEVERHVRHAVREELYSLMKTEVRALVREVVADRINVLVTVKEAQ